MRYFRLLFQQLKFKNKRYLLMVVSLGLCIGLTGIFFFLKKGDTTSANWYDDNFLYRQSINFTHNAAISSPRSVTFSLDTAELISDGVIQSDCDDVRFTDINGNPLRYQRTGTCNNAATTYEIQFPSIINGGNAAYVYYGNGTATSKSQTIGVTTLTPNGGDPSITTRTAEEKVPSPAASWHFDESTGTTAQDASGNNADGTLTNGPVWKAPTECINGSCIYLDGTNDYVSTPTSNTVRGLSTFSISAWFKPTRLNGTEQNIYVEPRNSDGTVRAQLTIDSSNQLSFGVRAPDSGSFIELVNDNRTLEVNQWYHVVAVFNATTDIHTLYLNGVGKTSSVAVAAIDNTNPSSNAPRIGSNIGSGYFQGFIDEVRLYKYARSDSQVASDFIERGSVRGVAAQLGDSDLDRKLTDGLVAHWKLDEGTGTTSSDASGNNFTLAQRATVGWATGKYGSSLLADSGQFYATDNDVFDNTSNITISAWLNRDNAVDWQRIIGKYYYDGANNGSWYMYITDQNKISFSINNGTTFPSVVTPDAINLDQWYLVTGTYDGRNLKLYLNGELVATTATNGSIPNTAYCVTLGYTANTDCTSNAQNALDGQLDDVRIYRRTLAPSEVRALYNYTPGPLAYWKLDDNQGGDSATIIDSSTNSNTGTIETGGGSGFSTSVYDTYTEGSNTAITSHTPDTGTSWTEVLDTTSAGTNMQVTAATDILESSISSEAGVGQFYTAQPAPAGVDQSISVTLSAMPTDTNTRPAYIFGRRTDNSNLYYVRIMSNAHATNSLTLYKAVSGTATSLGTVDTTLANGDVIKLELFDTAKKVYVNGAEVISSADNVLTSAGTWGLGVGNLGTTGGGGGNLSNAWDFDDFTAETTMSDNDTTSKWVPGKYGSAFSFDGTSDYIETSTNNSLKGAGQFTLNAWIKPYVLNSTEQDIYVEPRASDGSIRVQLTIASDNKLYFGIRSPDSGSTVTLIDDPRSLSTNTWYHVAAVFDSVTDLHTLYLNGVGVTSNVATVGLNNTAPNTAPRIGSSIGSGFFKGAIDDVKIYNFARTPGQIIQDMNAGHPLGGSPVGSQVSYWKFDEGYGSTANDSSRRGNNATINDGTWTNNGKFGKALLFDGTNDYLTMTDLTALPSGTAPRTMCAWLNTSLNDSGYRFAVSYGEGANSQAMFLGQNGPDLYGGGWADDLIIPNFFVLNTWYHVCLTYDGTTARLYTNGVLRSSAAKNWPLTRYFGYIGRQINALEYWKGMIDEVKIYNAALTPEEILIDYNRGKAIVFGSSSTASDGKTTDNSMARKYCVPGDTSTCNAPVGEWKLDENNGTSTTYDTSSNSANGTLTSIVKANWVQGKSGSALQLDGTNDYVDIGTGPSSVKTISFWVYPKTTTEYFVNLTSTTDYIWANAGTVTATGFTSPTIYVNGVVSSTIVANKWQHITVTTGTAENASNFDIGRTQNTNYLEGSIDEVLLFNEERTPAQVAWTYNKGAPLLHYKLDECQGTTAYNSARDGSNRALGLNGTLTPGGSGNTSAGTCTSGSNSEMWSKGASGKINAGIHLDGTDDYVETAFDSRFDFGASQDFTVATWVKTTLPQQVILWPHMISHEDNDVSRQGYNLVAANADANPEWYFQIYTANNMYVAYGRSNIRDGTWHHIVAMRQGSNLITYEDGKYVRTIAASSGTLVQSAPLRLGGNANVSPDSWSVFGGQLDDVRIYNYALTAVQVKDIYNNGAVSFK